MTVYNVDDLDRWWKTMTMRDLQHGHIAMFCGAWYIYDGAANRWRHLGDLKPRLDARAVEVSTSAHAGRPPLSRSATRASRWTSIARRHAWVIAVVVAVASYSLGSYAERAAAPGPQHDGPGLMPRKQRPLEAPIGEVRSVKSEMYPEEINTAEVKPRAMPPRSPSVRFQHPIGTPARPAPSQQLGAPRRPGPRPPSGREPTLLDESVRQRITRMRGPRGGDGI